MGAEQTLLKPRLRGLHPGSLGTFYRNATIGIKAVEDYVKHCWFFATGVARFGVPAERTSSRFCFHFPRRSGTLVCRNEPFLLVNE